MKHLQAFEYGLTGDPDEADHPYHYSDDVAELLQKTYLRVHKKKPHFIPELHKLIEKYPKIPAFKTLLSVYYQMQGKLEKAFEVNHWIVKEHPEYLHGKMNLAAEYIEKGDLEKVPEVLGQALDLQNLYPDRKMFHITEFSAFLKVSCTYLIRTGKIGAAESRIKMAEEILEKNHETLNYLRNEILEQRLRERRRQQEAWDEHHEGLVLRSYDESIQTSQPPVFQHPEVEILYRESLRIAPEKLREILALPRATLVEDLRKVLWDAVLRYEYFVAETDEWERWDETRLSFPLHALFLLTELGAEEELPLILDLLRQGEKLLEFWFDDHIFETLWRLIYRLSNHRLDELKQFMLEPDIHGNGKNVLSQAVLQTALHQPERQDEIVAWYRDIFRHYLDHLDEPNLVDEYLLAPLIADAADLRALELLPLCKSFFDLNLVDLSFAGNYSVIEQEFHSPPDGREKYAVYPSVFDHYRHITTEWAGYLSEEENRKRQAAWQERLKELNPDFFENDDDEKEPEQNYYRPQTVKKESSKVGRNDPCPCGSGKKYKKCCMKG